MYIGVKQRLLQELTTLLKVGDVAAFTEIYNRFFKVLFLHAVKRLRDEDEARDLVQELFSVLWIKRETAVAKTNLSNYLYTATRNGVFNFIARQKVAAKYMAHLPSEIDESLQWKPEDYNMDSDRLDTLMKSVWQEIGNRHCW